MWARSTDLAVVGGDAGFCQVNEVWNNGGNKMMITINNNKWIIQIIIYNKWGNETNKWTEAKMK